jgi:hypothetical protein
MSEKATKFIEEEEQRPEKELKSRQRSTKFSRE